MSKIMEILRGSLGIFNIFWFLLLSFMCLGSQFQLFLFFFLGAGYLLLACGLLSRAAWIKKAFFYIIVPISVLTALNITAMGTTLAAAYFRITSIQQGLFIVTFIGVPFMFNAIYILENPTAKFIAATGFIVMLILISRLASMAF